jgi:hypothetical protein
MANPLQWFDDRYYYGGGNGRYQTFKLALEELSKIPEPLIVETGCQRLPEDLGAGMSTSIFGEFLSRKGAGKLITIDIDKSHLAFCQIYTASYSKFITYVAMDSLKFLRNFDQPIDCLYLDSLDFPIGMYAGNERMVQNCQQHCLSEFMAVRSLFKIGSILLVDDNETQERAGKPGLLKQHIKVQNRSLRSEFQLLLEGQQILWRKQV